MFQLWSSRKTGYNDQQWHEISLQRYETNVSMQIDEFITRYVSELNRNCVMRFGSSSLFMSHTYVFISLWFIIFCFSPLLRCRCMCAYVCVLTITPPVCSCHSTITIIFHCFIFRKTMPTQIAELNVHFGVFLGGLGDFSESYLSSVDNFRGCMSDVNVVHYTRYSIFFFFFFSFDFILFLFEFFVVPSNKTFVLHSFQMLILNWCTCEHPLVDG